MIGGANMEQLLKKVRKIIEKNGSIIFGVGVNT